MGGGDYQGKQYCASSWLHYAYVWGRGGEGGIYYGAIVKAILHVYTQCHVWPIATCAPFDPLYDANVHVHVHVHVCCVSTFH